MILFIRFLTKTLVFKKLKQTRLNEFDIGHWWANYDPQPKSVSSSDFPADQAFNVKV